MNTDNQIKQLVKEKYSEIAIQSKEKVSLFTEKSRRKMNAIIAHPEAAVVNSINFE